jgi:hypothetical protein
VTEETTGSPASDQVKTAAARLAAADLIIRRARAAAERTRRGRGAADRHEEAIQPE